MSTPDPSRPLVSIIVPSYNQGRYLAATLDSIFAQSYRPLDVVVMDGASKDDTRGVLERYARRHPELRWRSEPDRGVVDAVNKGLAWARGAYAGIQSSDDLYQGQAVAEAVAELEAHPDVGLVYGDAEIVDEDGRNAELAPFRLPYTQARFLARSTIIHQSSAFFRLDLARAIGGWDARYYCADTEWWLRMSFRTRIVKVDRCWSAWRKHPSQRDKAGDAMWDSWGRMVSESADLRTAPLRLRLAAQAGRRVLAQDYRPRAAFPGFVPLQVWLALLLYPPSLKAIRDKGILVPGMYKVREWLRHGGR